MSVKKASLIGIVLVGGIGLAAAVLGYPTSKNAQYNWEGKIGEDQVSFRHRYFSLPSFIPNYVQAGNILTVIKQDGRVIRYVDSKKDDLKLEYIEVTKDNKSKKSPNDELEKQVLEEAQKQFDSYLQKIKEIRVKQGLESLK